MIADCEIALARPADSRRIAMMSRDLVEHGLTWRWTPQRILRVIHDASINVAVARDKGALAGFAVMQYKDDEAHLLLLAVDYAYRQKGVGSALMGWMEATALVAGTGCIYLEARKANAQARQFYARLGYREVAEVTGLYSNNEDGVRLAKDLWAT
ncbi:MAG: GNAT family N-acetyltransferase [Dokdonella sp.]|uniref:GNAT family N-acetyltransferase n=1 Tax=Dokdonella sp. TaxID=2291710 RepID=UPI003267C45A